VLFLNHTLYAKESATKRETFTNLFEGLPLPKHKDSIVWYNDDLYNKLIDKLLQTDKPDRKFKIVANGGSTTAGGGHRSLPDGQRYYSRFADHLNNILSSKRTGVPHQPIETIGQGHGGRSSLHSAINFDKFIPSDTDLLFWEFSINDVADYRYNQENRFNTAKQNFVAWLQKVNAMEKPPMVVLIYYWNSPFQANQTTGEIISETFTAHGDIARQFDFVVGHVNMAKYMDNELTLRTCGSFRTCPIISKRDKIHASRVGHEATAFLLLNMLNPRLAPQSAIVSPPVSNQTFHDNVSHVWTCGVETEAKRVLKSVTTNSSTGWKSPIGSWTLELPVYNQESPMSLVPSRPLEDKDIEMVVDGDGIRYDKQRVTPLNQCGKNSFSLTAPFEPMRNVRAMLMSFKSKGLGGAIEPHEFNVQLNGSNKTTAGELVPMLVIRSPEIADEWPCHFACPSVLGTHFDHYWYVLNSTEPVVNSIRMCIPSGIRRKPKIQSMSFW